MRQSKFVLLLLEESNQTSANLSNAHQPEICNDVGFDDENIDVMLKSVFKRHILAIMTMGWKLKRSCILI